MSVLVWLPENIWQAKADVGATVGTGLGTADGAVGCAVGAAVGRPSVMVGLTDGSALGTAVGLAVVGLKVGIELGTGVLAGDGTGVGETVGSVLGTGLGFDEGSALGKGVPAAEGLTEGAKVGSALGNGVGKVVGMGVAANVGAAVGANVTSFTPVPAIAALPEHVVWPVQPSRMMYVWVAAPTGTVYCTWAHTVLPEMQAEGGRLPVPVSSYTTSTLVAEKTRRVVEPVHEAPAYSAPHMLTVKVWPALAVTPHTGSLLVSVLV